MRLKTKDVYKLPSIYVSTSSTWQKIVSLSLACPELPLKYSRLFGRCIRKWHWQNKNSSYWLLYCTGASLLTFPPFRCAQANLYSLYNSSLFQNWFCCVAKLPVKGEYTKAYFLINAFSSSWKLVIFSKMRNDFFRIVFLRQAFKRCQWL